MTRDPSTRPLHVLCWEGYDHPTLIEPFRTRTGVPIEAEPLTCDAHAAKMLLDVQQRWDVVNINNAYISKYLHPAMRVRSLPPAPFAQALEQTLPAFQRFLPWTRSADGTQLIGIGQRFGAFNLVVNTDLISRELAEAQGFALTEDQRLPFGVLRYEDFNIFHICIAAGLNPFVPLTSDQHDAFERMARRWATRARLVSDDHHELNRALLDRRIAYYLSGGTYTASPVRLDGHYQVEAVTPRHGPIDGRGGIAFAEVTSLLASPNPHPKALDYLAYLLEPESAIRIAFVEGTCNPVAQMSDPRVMRAFSGAQLKAIQWDRLEEDLAHCVDYDIVPDHDLLLARLLASFDGRE